LLTNEIVLFAVA